MSNDVFEIVIQQKRGAQSCVCLVLLLKWGVTDLFIYLFGVKCCSSFISVQLPTSVSS